MGDPELRSDETVLVRTQDVYVKSIPFEGILTNKRIVLIDRTKNHLPLKEIPLVTIKDVEGGENAIRDPVVTITVITRTGETRQMVLTFSRTAGGNRNKERDEWVKTLKENVSSSFEQVVRKGTPGLDQPQRRPGPTPRIDVARSPVQPAVPRSLPRKEAEMIQPIKKIIEKAPSATPAAAKVSDVPAQGYGTFCSRCGNKVPEGSGFCNRCGSSIIPPGSTVPAVPAAPQRYVPPEPPEQKRASRPPSPQYERPLEPVATPPPAPAAADYRTPAQRPGEREIPVAEPQNERSPVEMPAAPQSVPPEPPVQEPAPRPPSPLYEIPPEPVFTPPPAPAVTAPQQKPVKKRLIPRLFSPKELSATPLNPASMPTAVPPAPKKPRRTIRMPGKKVFIAIGVIILLIVIAVAGVVFVYPMISGSESPIPGSATQTPATTSTPAPSSPSASSGASVTPRVTTAASAPATNVYAHVSYIGSWKGTYGMPSALQTVTSSGDKFLEIENATGPVEVTMEKLDGSTRHELVVEITKNGGVLTSSKTSEGYGKVKVSADVTTGVAQAPQTGVGTPAATAAPAPGTATTPAVSATTVTTTSAPVTNVTTVSTTTPVTNTTTSSS
ncbi:MAG: zinc-ribbon domain-containing protein [Methanoregula sp.]